MARYSFSGHDSFYCKSLWLKKGYDFLIQEYSFNAPDAVAELGVGKNMVSSIRYWLKSFGLTIDDKLTKIANYLFHPETGRDKYAEDLTTLWLLHYLLVYTNVASIYNLLFLSFQREKREFDKEQLQQFLKRKCDVPEQKNVYNENTINKDIRVMLQNYVMPNDLKSLEDFSALLINLNLIRMNEEKKYSFNSKNKDEVPAVVVLYALIDMKGNDKTISFDMLLDVSLLFCMSITDLISIIKKIEKDFPGIITYNDNSGVRNVQFLKEIDKLEVLDTYYIKQ